MNVIEVSEVAKSFGQLKAVDGISFEVRSGEIFGLLGPNGAGKTTTIRMILDIFKPERGQIAVLGGPMSEQKKERIGYMPEERGLYQDLQLERCLLYLAALKGMSDQVARERLEHYLERFDLADQRKKKVKELSKGMQQKAQIITTILHQPELILVDEPFAALDPVNTQMVEELMQELRRQGATIVMSTHQMHQVEELCDRILLINHGKAMLYGALNDIRRQFSGHAVLVRADGELPAIRGVEQSLRQNHMVKLELAEDASPQSVLLELVQQGAQLEKFEVAVPSLDEIFIRVVREQAAG